jgi:hypothetical protein
LPRPRDDASRPPVLIEVPRLRSHAARSGGPHATTARPRARIPARPRRRLRREFRVAGAILGLLSTGAGLAFALIAFTTGPGHRVEATGPPVEPPAVFLSTELQPVGAPAGTEADGPQVEPSGYLLPDDAPEDEAHAGS